jgi:hypothetical protein
MRLWYFSLAMVAALAMAPEAGASGGHYRFDGGTTYQRQQVVQALNVSTFNWNVVPWTVTITIRPGSLKSAGVEAGGVSPPRHITIRADQLDQGIRSWGLVQHEYAHQVDFSRFDDPIRKRLTYLLMGKTWWWRPGVDHAWAGAERFASTLAWTYWPSPDNVLGTTQVFESTAMAPAPFKKLMRALVGCCY